MAAGRVQGQVAWISGAGRGIGEGTAKFFAEEGAAVAIVDICEEAGIRVAEEIKAKGGQAIFIHCDLVQREQVKASIEKTVETFGGIQILVNNAAIGHNKMLHEFTDEEWDQEMNVNVKSIFLSFQYAFEHLIKNERSYIVNIGSISSFVGQDRTPVYTTTKGAILLLSRSIALDYARYGIRCNCICPGITDTFMLHQETNLYPDPKAHLAKRLDRVAANVLMSTRDIAKAILYLSCEDSSGITGTSLVIDGGYLAAAEWSCTSVKNPIKTRTQK